MIVAHTGDLHITEKPGPGAATLDEQTGILDWIGNDAHKAGAEAMLVAGDIFDKASTPAERNAAIDVFARWAELFPVVVAYGNHDRPGDLNFLRFAERDFPVKVADIPQTVTPQGLRVECLPWPRKANIVALMEAATGCDYENIAQSAMAAILASMRVKCDATSNPSVLLAHAELGAALMDSGQPLAGRCDIELSEGDLLDTGADYIALGHIHKAQTLGDGKIRYCGSPRPTAFGQEDPKGYSLVEVIPGQAPIIEHRESPAHRMISAVAAYDGDRDELIPSEDRPGLVQGAAYRLSYVATSSERGAARKEAERIRDSMIYQGARSVMLDPRITQTHRVRSEGIRRAIRTDEKLSAYWDNVGRPKREQQLVAKLAELEGGLLP